MKSPSESKRVAVCTMAVVALTLLLSASVYPQVAGATLSGTVIDPSGAIVPQAQISIKNLATGIDTAAPANADGLYSAPNLLPGDYEVTVSAPGFKTERRSGIKLTVGAQQVLNVTLQVGQSTQQVEVAGAAPAVELASSSISAVVSSNTVVDLPLNGRDWTSLATLSPAVNVIPTQQPAGVEASRGARGNGNKLSVSGTRPQANNYRLDGISIVDYSNGAPGSSLGVSLGVDAIAEFSVLTANYSAEYGRTSGGVVNAITKSGTNQFHGDAYWFLRDEDFDARQFFDSMIPPFHRNQFGGSVGGPIQKDKTFFFADFEGLREARGVTNVDNVPSPDARNGIIHNSDGSTTTITNSTGALGVDPAVKPYLAFYPLPNAGLIGDGNTGHFIFAANTINHENFTTVKIDRKISDKNSIRGSWFYDTASNDTPDGLDININGNLSLRQMVALEETHIFSPSLVNSLRGGYSRVSATVSQSIQTNNPLALDTSLGAFPGKTSPEIYATGLTNFLGGLGATGLARYLWNSFQAYDDAFLTKGVHSMKFGFAFERMQSNTLSTNEPNGLFKFGSLEALLANQPKNFLGLVNNAEPMFGLRQSLFGGYLEDDWRWHPNVTINLGLRYEMSTEPTEAHNRQTNLPTFTSPTPRLGAPLFNNPTLRNFEPRVGFSWDPFRNGKTAVRGAFGIFDVLPLGYELLTTTKNTVPFQELFSENNLSPGSFPTKAVASITSPPASTLQFASVQFNPPRNYVMIWNFNIQQQLTPTTTAMVGYVGNHGVHMLDRSDDANLVLPTATSQGYLWPSPPGSGTVMNPNVGDMRALYWGGDSEYDALEVQVTKRMNHGFQVQGSYTWGKNIDTNSSSTHGDTFTNSISSLPWFCKACRRGLSDFDIAQTLVVNYLWDVPTPKSWGAFGSHVLGGWQLGGIITAETGVPITPLIGGDPLGMNSQDAWAFPNRLNTPGCSSVVNPGNPNNYIKLNCFAVPMASPSIAAQCTPFGFVAPSTGEPGNPGIAGSCANLYGNAGRNTVVGPGLATYDFSLFKNNYIRRISENFNIQFRAEFFNILNRANFATPIDNETLFDQNGVPVGGAGAIDQTSTTAREIQFALKLIW